MIKKVLRRAAMAGIGGAVMLWEAGRTLYTSCIDRGADIMNRSEDTAMRIWQEYKQKSEEEAPDEPPVPHTQSTQPDDPVETLRTMLRSLSPEQRDELWKKLGE
jgi:DNA-directed RNA polymerase specialized sigma24 family protein